jgi:hypothetical protein
VLGLFLGHADGKVIKVEHWTFLLQASNRSNSEETIQVIQYIQIYTGNTGPLDVHFSHCKKGSFKIVIPLRSQLCALIGSDQDMELL